MRPMRMAGFLVRKNPVDAARHAQVGLGKVVAGVELQHCWNVTLDKQLFHRARIVEHVPHHAVGRLGFLFAE